MRILCVAWMNPTSTDMPLFHVMQWRQMGHEVELIPFDLAVTDDPLVGFLNSIEGCEMEIGERRIANACERFRPDLVLFFYHFMRVDPMKRLRAKHGCKIGFYLDNNNLLWRDTAQCMSAADFVTLHDRYVERLIRGTSAGRNPNVFYIPGAAEPEEHRPLELSPWDRSRYECGVAFIGGSGPDRLDALQRMQAHNLSIWGEADDWGRYPELRRFVSDEPVYGLKKTKIYNLAAIVLNLEEGEKQINAINPRICEVLASGGFVLTNHTAELEAYGFQDGVSIAWFHSPEEMEEKAAHYLSHPEHRRAISERGREIVFEKLTYRKISREWMNWMESLCIKK
jgi:spore maturation protein CgeB